MTVTSAIQRTVVAVLLLTVSSEPPVVLAKGADSSASSKSKKMAMKKMSSAKSVMAMMKISSKDKNAMRKKADKSMRKRKDDDSDSMKDKSEKEDNDPIMDPSPDIPTQEPPAPVEIPQPTEEPPMKPTDAPTKPPVEELTNAPDVTTPTDPPGSMTEETLLQKAVDFLGGRNAIMSLNKWKIEATGETWIAYESEKPGDLVAGSSYQRTYFFDTPADRMRVETTSTPKFEAFAFFPQQSYARVVDGNMGGLTEQALFFPPGGLNSASVAALKRQQLLFNPHLILRMVLENPDIVSYLGNQDGRDILSIETEVTPIRLFLNGTSGMISEMATRESHPLLRDTRISVRYMGWNLEATSSDGTSMLFPSTVRLAGVDGTLWEEQRSLVDIEPVIEDTIFDVPSGSDPNVFDPESYQFGLDAHHVQEGFFMTGFSFPYSVPIATPVELATGVYLMSSSVTNGLVIEYSEGLILVPESGSEVQSSRVMDTVEQLFPGKPVTHLIQSHHHVDHAGGLRALIALTSADVVVGHGVGEFWGDVLAARSTIRSDGLTETNQGEIIEVGESAALVLVAEDDLEVTVHHTTHDPHAEDALIVHIVSSGQAFVFAADTYNAGLGLTIVVGGPEGLFDAMRELGFINSECSTDLPTTIVPTHGSVQSVEQSRAELSALGVDVGC